MSIFLYFTQYKTLCHMPAITGYLNGNQISLMMTIGIIPVRWEKNQTHIISFVFTLNSTSFQYSAANKLVKIEVFFQIKSFLQNITSKNEKLAWISYMEQNLWIRYEKVLEIQLYNLVEVSLLYAWRPGNTYLW